MPGQCLLSTEEIRFLLRPDDEAPAKAAATVIRLEHYLKMTCFSNRLRRKARRRAERPAA